MDEKGLTQKRVAVDAKVSQVAVHKWLKGASPGAAELFNLASANGVTVEWFLGGDENQELTIAAESLTTDGVKPVMPSLIQRLKRATKERGQKSALAKWLGVHRQCVADWLSGKQSPGGEYTLQLLKWVELQERQKNADPKNAL